MAIDFLSLQVSRQPPSAVHCLYSVPGSSKSWDLSILKKKRPGLQRTLGAKTRMKATVSEVAAVAAVKTLSQLRQKEERRSQEPCPSQWKRNPFVSEREQRERERASGEKAESRAFFPLFSFAEISPSQLTKRQK